MCNGASSQAAVERQSEPYAREWAQSLDAGVNAGSIAVVTACLDYVQHLMLHKGERAAYDERQRLKPVYECRRDLRALDTTRSAKGVIGQVMSPTRTFVVSTMR